MRRTTIQEKKTVLTIMLICGIIYTLIFIGSDILAGKLWKGYNFISQSISALSAIGAPTRSLVVPIEITNYILMIAFGLGIWGLAGQKRALQITACLLAGYAILSLTGTFFPLSISKTMIISTNPTNVILNGLSMLLLLLAIGFGAAAHRNWFRFYSIGTLLSFLVLTIFGLFVVPQIAAGQSRTGIQERIMVYGCLLWVMVLAIVLLRVEKRQG